MVRLLVTRSLGDYFNLRKLDSELQILIRTVEALQKGLDLVIAAQWRRRVWLGCRQEKHC